MALLLVCLLSDIGNIWEGKKWNNCNIHGSLKLKLGWFQFLILFSI
jgi:hypothetical protein